MKDRIYLINLYDYYSPLLTERQQEYFEDYYHNNLTLSEMSENDGVSRSAIQKALKEIETKLKSYEDRIHIYAKMTKINELDIDESIKDTIIEILEG